MLLVVTMEKLLLDAINHIKNVCKKKPITECLLTYINKSSAKNCDKATIGDTLCILRTKNLIYQNLKLLSEYNDEIFPTPLPGRIGRDENIPCKF